jgi:hypothetical protein
MASKYAPITSCTAGATLLCIPQDHSRAEDLRHSMTEQPQTTLRRTCTLCGDELDQEEIEFPQKNKDGAIICDRCFDDRYSHLCPICENNFSENFEEQISPKYLLVTKDVGEEFGIESGIYEIIAYPFFADGITEWHLITSALKRIADIPEDFDDDSMTLHYICDECVKKQVGQ